MITNTYIGNRYIPLFDGAHNPEKEYEPLTIVEYNGASYTSKTNVPPGVEITNTTFWFCSGNYNAQVEQYRREVLSACSEIKQSFNDFQENQETKFNIILSNSEKKIDDFIKESYQNVNLDINSLISRFEIVKSEIDSDITLYKQSVEQYKNTTISEINNKKNEIANLLKENNIIFDGGSYLDTIDENYLIYDGGNY